MPPQSQVLINGIIGMWPRQEAPNSIGIVALKCKKPILTEVASPEAVCDWRFRPATPTDLIIGFPGPHVLLMGKTAWQHRRR